MSFSYDLKCELCAEETVDERHRHALAYGMLLFGKAFSGRQVSLVTENEGVAALYGQCIAEEAGLISCTTVSPVKNRDSIYTVSLQNKGDCAEVLGLFYHQPDEISLRLKMQNLPDEGSVAYFLRGAYLACGNLTDPYKSYHLEFVTQHYKLAEDLQQLISTVLAPPKMTVRRGARVVYYKESEHIEDMLTYIGAMRSSLELMNVKIYKDLRNKANRVTNCETANIEKTVTAAAKQVEDIELIAAHRGMQSLSDDLQELAVLRLEHPEMSLADLGRELSQPLSRSGVNHRFQRIAAAAETIRKERALR
ncbi:DNA-binding protein WhiA [Zongyangia hominis]|uniref:Probable cell division protein WhiA n=1 Tax=Zongyangia hominis TaxID=2763677 RepID=A0A926EAL6_9FIRM|nr:DNA-binding protein WhiA [Zongyangia hominis]MBC8569528.1 DNA-binding protein WhiA [Zongyangia hominis]